MNDAEAIIEVEAYRTAVYNNMRAWETATYAQEPANAEQLSAAVAERLALVECALNPSSQRPH